MTDPIPLAYSTPPDDAVPTVLKIVAWLFIISGVLTLLQILIDLTHSRITINTGILGIFVGRGLLRYSPGWRTCGLVLLWIGMIFAPIALLIMLSAHGWANVDLLGIRMGQAPVAFAFILDILFFGLAVWEYRVLVREDIRERFGLPPRAN